MELTMAELRELSGYAAASAEEVLGIFERVCPEDDRPRVAVAAAWEFARGGPRGKPLRDAAWAALKAAGAAGDEAAGQAARAAVAAASAAYLHPLAKATQVKHILGAAAHAARAAELAGHADLLEPARRRATPGVVAVLRRYPPAPAGGGRPGELMRELDQALRER